MDKDTYKELKDISDTIDVVSIKEIQELSRMLIEKLYHIKLYDTVDLAGFIEDKPKLYKKFTSFYRYNECSECCLSGMGNTETQCCKDGTLDWPGHK